MISFNVRKIIFYWEGFEKLLFFVKNLMIKIGFVKLAFDGNTVR